MKKFFVDTNVILSWLISSRDTHSEATSFMKEIFMGRVEGFVSSHSLSDIFYIARKSYSVEERKNFLLLIASNFQIVPENQNDFFEVLSSPTFFDIEDGLQMRCAEKVVVDYIVTENLKDFSSSRVPAVDTASAMQIILN